MARLSGGRLASDAEWDAFLAGDLRGVIYGVISTGICCRQGCPARKPLRKNLRLFEGVEAAEAAGFRCCKRCGGGR
jgi:methylphosphotriester-DNA--protein-cysteine methyltransferase